MIPVAGTCLVIFSAKQESIWASNRLAQAIGHWSYSDLPGTGRSWLACAILR